MLGYEQILTVKRIQEASEVMGALQDAFGKLQISDGDAHKRSLLASLQVKLAQLSLTATAYYMHQGQELHDALITTLKSELKLYPDKLTEFGARDGVNFG